MLFVGARTDPRSVGLNEHYVRECLGAMVTAGVVEVEGSNGSEV